MESEAVKLVKAGLSVIQIADGKRPAGKWSEFQDRLPTEIEASSIVPPIGIICGKVSGGLFCIDADTKNDPGDEIYTMWKNSIKETFPELLKKLIVERTPSGGFHFIGRCQKPIRNRKLAGHADNEKAALETRGEGGYFVCAPSPGYTLTQGSFTEIQTITPEEFDFIINSAVALNKQVKNEFSHHNENNENTPFNEYDKKCTPKEFASLLTGCGWKITKTNGTHYQLQRPGKKGRDPSGTVNYIPDRFYCFTTSTCFESEKVYKPSAVYAMLYHSGDFSAAAKALYQQGYGEKKTSFKQPHFSVPKISSADKIKDSLLNVWKNGIPKGASTGWSLLDELYTVVSGQLNILTGIASHGKSEWLDALMINLSDRLKWNWVIYSPENYPLELHYTKLFEKLAECKITKIKDKELISDAARFISDHFHFVDGENAYTFDEIFNLVRELKKTKNIHGVVIDPWNETQHFKPREMSDTNYVSYILGEARRFARSNNISFWIVAHPTKLKKTDKGDYPVPTMYDISDSAHWYNKADNGIVIYRKEFEVEVHVQKVKFKYYGRPGMAKFFYEYDTGKYIEAESPKGVEITQRSFLNGIPVGDR